MKPFKVIKRYISKRIKKEVPQIKEHLMSDSKNKFIIQSVTDIGNGLVELLVRSKDMTKKITDLAIRNYKEGQYFILSDSEIENLKWL